MPGPKVEERFKLSLGSFNLFDPRVPFGVKLFGEESRDGLLSEAIVL